MNQAQIFLFEKTSTELIEQVFKKVNKASEKYGTDMAFALLANVGQLACGMALSLQEDIGGVEATKETHKKICDAIWASSQNYKMKRFKRNVNG